MEADYPANGVPFPRLFTIRLRGPSALKRSTQSRTICNVTSPNFAASLRAAKAAFFELARRDAPPDLARAAALADACYDSADYAEGRAARQERRPPRFQGR